jgi:hypothetical protein
MNKINLKRLTIFVISISFTLMTRTAMAQKTDFSGSYTIDTSKTNFGQAPKWTVSKNLKVSQQKSEVILSLTGLNEDLTERAPVTDSLAFDGTPFQRSAGDGLTTICILKWVSDQSFVISRKTGKRSVSETWTLEDGGKSLVVERSVEQANGLKYTIKCIYDRQ